jgi:hypothetical protein
MGRHCAEIMMREPRAVGWRWSTSTLMELATIFRDGHERHPVHVTRRWCGGAATVDSNFSFWLAAGLRFILGRAMEFCSGDRAADK